MQKAALNLWRVTTGLSAAGLVAAMIAWFALFVIEAPSGCMGGMAFTIELGLTIIFLAVWSGLAALIGLGTFFSSRGSSLGPHFMAAANVPLIVFFGWWDPVAAGQLIWGWIVVGFAVLPLMALLLAAIQLIAGGSTPHLVGAFLFLLIGALLLPYLVGHGWALDLGYAYQSPPPPDIAHNARPC